MKKEKKEEKIFEEFEDLIVKAIDVNKKYHSEYAYPSFDYHSGRYNTLMVIKLYFNGDKTELKKLTGVE